MMTDEKIKNPNMTANLILIQKNMPVSLSVLPDSRDFHLMRHWDYFIIPKSIS